jgi:NAD(P)-dependent dehydrogenase (short-subunit alcohol dehydrogenase family)
MQPTRHSETIATTGFSMFKDKRVLVTGGSRGLGWATAKAFHDAGAKVAVNGRTIESTMAAIESLGGGERLIAAPGDVGTVAGCDALVRTAVDTLGGLDVLVNSAGVATVGLIEDATEAIWDAMIDVNLKGTYFCCRAAVPALRESRGNIVNIASTEGLMGLKEASIYCASKGGVVLLTRALSAELAPDMRINCVCPGYIDTDMVRRDWIDKTDNPAATLRDEIEAFAPMNRIGTPKEVSAAILYLASDQAGFTTGAALAVDGGATATN